MEQEMCARLRKGLEENLEDNQKNYCRLKLETRAMGIAIGSGATVPGKKRHMTRDNNIVIVVVIIRKHLEGPSRETNAVFLFGADSNFFCYNT